MRVHEDLEYWGIDKNLMDACCALIHYPELELSQKESIREKDSRVLAAQIEHEENFGQSFIGKCRSSLWNLTEYPEGSVVAKVH